MESPVPAHADPDTPAAPADPDTPAAPAAAIPAPAGGPPAATGPVWRFLIQPRWVAWHLFTVAAIWGMLWLGDWQLHRALAGNGLSWAYTFEWPLFAGFGLVFWARTIRDEFRLRRGGEGAPGSETASEPALPEGVGIRQAGQPADGAADAGADDPELASYNAYLARLHAEVKGHGKWRGLR